MTRNFSIIYIFVYVNDLAVSREFYERALELNVIESDQNSVKYDSGEVILALNKASDYGITIREGHDDTSLIVFYAADIDNMLETLSGKDVVFEPTLRYEIGATAAFYDPDGHCLTLYQPSEEAMTWESGSKIREVLEKGGEGKRLIYLFVFVRNTEEAFHFYHELLGLTILEEDPEAGVVKYDCGGIILATHLVGGDANCAVEMDLSSAKSIAPVFYVEDIKSTVSDLTARGVHFLSGIVKAEIGWTIRMADPNGHVYFLYQLSAEAGSWPSGEKIRRIIYHD